VVNDWVKKGIIVGFRAGQIEDYSINPLFPTWPEGSCACRPCS
jgi:hypothetical protein